MILYHGSTRIIDRPRLALGKAHNDYGPGFYCTEDQELACEWACKGDCDGYANGYELATDGLKVLNLLDPQYTILNWMALLLTNRTFSLQDEIAMDARDYLIERFRVDLDGVDVITGYRANDSYFAFAQSFVSNALPLRTLNRALRLGELGVQVALVSERAFSQLTFVSAKPAPREIFYPRFFERDSKARAAYRNELKRGRTYRNDIYVLDILREEIGNGDPRLQRLVSE